MTTLRLDDLRQHRDVLRLRTGETLAVRFVEPGDAEALQDYFRSLSVRSRYNRFLGAMSELSPRELDHFIHPGESDRFSVIAVMIVDGVETIVGEGWSCVQRAAGKTQSGERLAPVPPIQTDFAGFVTAASSYAKQKMPRSELEER